ncbi:MAG: RagB/SusD family nutrient uptake outer membrane protein [Candidatus Kapabacteria bacterium]|nr:RagB/SusD family nutrient uptake outer membrane protein [Candidatus Kapabacteria bacterium]
MKNTLNIKSVKTTFLLAIITFFIYSCGIDSGLNKSPNAISADKVKSAIGVQGLTVALQVAAGDFYSGDHSRILSFWCWQMCAPDGLGRPQPLSWNDYAQTVDGPPDDSWKTAYRGITVANKIIEYSPSVQFDLADAANNTKLQNTYLGLAKAYKALFFGELAACYGSIIVNFDGLNPSHFSTQQVAFDTVQSLLDQSIEHFKVGGGSIAQEMNFQGDAAKWTALSHTLKARYYMLVKNYSKCLTESNNGIKDATGNLMGMYSLTSDEYSPWGHWSYTEVGQPIRGEANMVRLLKSEPGDKRLALYFTSPTGAGGSFWGAAIHEASANPNEDSASADINQDKVVRLGDKFAAYDANFPLATYQENVLMIAECSARASDNPTATTNLDIIRKAAGLAAYSGTTANLVTEILKQKYLELFLQGVPYYDMRRTGTLPAKAPAKAIPLRWVYPISEKNANPYVPADADNLMQLVLP